ncbi:aminotransferase class I/II-fold pyridoxal phosphate-dependent enzyme [Saccharopolyspora sp. SCSIO 74807]|uniref:pyridoxal phosphate-dependent aminotransferase n=1 Tax=Saccharopolyspora sp. SCSIO 74807 TaxID=3118084 RepID=UPI0030CA7AA5
MQLFRSIPAPHTTAVSEDALGSADREPRAPYVRTSFEHHVDDRVLEVFERANDPEDPFELRDLWLGRVESELGGHSHRPMLAERWRSARKRRGVDGAEVLASTTTVRFVKELFNWYFRDDLYGDLRRDDLIILSGGSVDEVAWGLPQTVKECLRYALDRDWYGYSDSRGRFNARDAVAQYENWRMGGHPYTVDNVAITLGGTFAISSLADFVLHGSSTDAPALCAIPNYPPLVETIARRHGVQLVPVSSVNGATCLDPLIEALRPDTPMVMLQTVGNPTGALVDEEDLARLIVAAAPSTTIVLDECHEWLGPLQRCPAARTASNVVRVSSLSKTWSAPGLKAGWLVADPAFVAEYYEYASTVFGGPPSFFYTAIEVLARMERWRNLDLETPGEAELAEFEPSYELDTRVLADAYRHYRAERELRQHSLEVLRRAATVRLTEAGLPVFPPHYSINSTIEPSGWSDSYRCFRDLLRETGVSVYPGVLNFCLSGSVGRITTARRWEELAAGIDRIGTSARWRTGRSSGD